MIDIRISRSEDGSTVWLHSHGGTRTFDATAWAELSKMIVDFNTLGVKKLQNFADLPTRTPIHANTPAPRGKATLDDLA